MIRPSPVRDSYELKSNFTVISGYSQLIVRECRKDSPDRDRVCGYAGSIQQLVNRLEQTIDRVIPPTGSSEEEYQ